MISGFFGRSLAPMGQQGIYDPYAMRNLIIAQKANYVLRVRAGPNLDSLTNIDVNYEHTPLKIETEDFKGYITVRIFGYSGIMGDPCHPPPSRAPYFSDNFSREALFSIQMVGQFLKPHLTADDVIFGNFFDHQLPLPMFSGVFEWLMKRMDRSLVLNMKSETPCAASPLLAAVQRLSYWKAPSEGDRQGELPDINPKIIRELQPPDGMFNKAGRVKENFPIKGVENHSSKKRRSYFVKSSHREKWKIKRDEVYACDFFSPFIDVNNGCIRMPNGIIEPMPYFDREIPLRYMCKTRDGRHTFFVVQIEFVDAPVRMPSRRAREQRRGDSSYGQSGYERTIIDPPPPYTPTAE